MATKSTLPPVPLDELKLRILATFPVGSKLTTTAVAARAAWELRNRTDRCWHVLRALEREGVVRQAGMIRSRGVDRVVWERVA
jgi:hypothetical protein